MTDTDPRLEVAKEAYLRLSVNAPEWQKFLAMYDALRAFDQAHVPGEWMTTKTLDRLQDRIAELEVAQPQPESEVRPHNPRTDSGPSSSGQDNVTAPIMGADPLWLDEAAKAALAGFFGKLPHSVFTQQRDDTQESWRSCVRAVLVFANAQPPSVGEIEGGAHAAREAWVCYPGPDWNAVSHAVLIAAAKARIGT